MTRILPFLVVALAIGCGQQRPDLTHGAKVDDTTPPPTSDPPDKGDPPDDNDPPDDEDPPDDPDPVIEPFELPMCADDCLYGDLSSAGACELWDEVSGSWVPMGDGTQSLHHRARQAEVWLREWMLPEGGVADVRFTDASHTDVAAYLSTGDSAIWTGTYLAAESLRAIATDSVDATDHVDALVGTLHDWFNVSGDPGYLARYAAPLDSSPEVLAVFDMDAKSTVIRDYKGEPWVYSGHISRDQYQGVMLGYSLAYEATDDEAVRQMIRDDVVELVEQLMKIETRRFRVEGGGLPFPITQSLQFRYTVFTEHETDSGDPSLILDLDDVENTDIFGYQEFHPRFYNVLADQILLLSWIPEIPRSGSAIMLASFFQVAMQVTEGVPEYAARRQVISDHYDDNFAWWFDIAEHPLGYESAYGCGDKYYAKNIRFEPMYNLARLDGDAARQLRIHGNVLEGIMWPDVADHKNSFFAFIRASQHPDQGAISSVIDDHVDQLAGYGAPPRFRDGVDLTGLYPADPACPGNSSQAIDVADRDDEGFIWQRHPWKMVEGGAPDTLHNDVDYLVAYWMGRRHGFIEDDTPDVCLRWRP